MLVQSQSRTLIRSVPLYQWVIAPLTVLISFFMFFLLLLLIWTLGDSVRCSNVGLRPRRDPQIVLWTEERVPELALAHNHTDEYFAYHHRSFIWRWMELETETHIGTLDLTP